MARQELENKWPTQQHIGSQEGWSLPFSFVTGVFWEMKDLPAYKHWAHATGLCPSVWVVALWTLERLHCRPLDPSPIIVNQLKHQI